VAGTTPAGLSGNCAELLDAERGSFVHSGAGQRPQRCSVTVQSTEDRIEQQIFNSYDV
jgi:hypothetical protein